MLFARPLLACLLLLAAPLSLSAADEAAPRSLDLKPIAGTKQRNVIFILVDDLRFDAFSFLGHPFIKTPQIDRLAKAGTNFSQAFVTTSLCSPSRASILTGLYMHNHKVMDNNNPAPPGTVFFPQYLQKAGYETAYFGKWHMGGGSDDPRPGFDRWVSFRGQGHYYSPGEKWTLNVDGQSVPQKGYITDELTDYTLDWLRGRSSDKPFFVYLSHKAVHAEFYPAERHKNLYSDIKIEEPASQANTAENYRDKPMWVKNQRNSWHGVDFPYHSRLDIQEYFRNYCRALAAVDDSVGRLLDYLHENKLDENTVVMFMGDNGFLFGEHGLIDKRNAYEESMRVPLIVQGPGLFPASSTIPSVVANIDIGPTILEIAGLNTPKYMDGRSFLGLATGKTKPADWRKNLLYEYYWEWNFPHTPTTFAIRGDRYKFIQYQGIWDTDELYDLQADPKEMHNLIREPEFQQVVKDMRNLLHQELEATGGMQIPLGKKMGSGANLRNADGTKAADFPPEVLREP